MVHYYAELFRFKKRGIFMKRKLILGMLIVSMAAPSAVYADAKDDRIAELEAQISELQEELNSLTTGDSDFEYTADGYTFKYLKSEVVNDSSWGDCVYVYFNFTNGSGSSCSPSSSLLIRAFQNGVEIESVSPGYNDNAPVENDNLYKQIQDGASVDIALLFKLDDDSDVSLELSPYFTDQDSVIGEYTFSLESEDSIEEYLLSSGVLSGDRTEMAADMVGAVSGFKYGDSEIYEYDESSDEYKTLAGGGSIPLQGFDGVTLSALAVNGKYVLMGSASDELISAFKSYGQGDQEESFDYTISTFE
jgi:hypothetical protein